MERGDGIKYESEIPFGDPYWYSREYKSPYYKVRHMLLSTSNFFF
jgi:hypothetical protein